MGWPSGTALRPASASQYTLVLVLHPRCPCSRATVSELDRLMARAGGKLSVSVLLIRPEGMAAGWERTDLWDRAAAIPGVNVLCDDGGREAARFGAVTSGQALLFDPRGRLLFRGGITASRGHEGDNAGSDAIVAAMGGATPSGDRATVATNRVYGCALGGAATRPAIAGAERCDPR